MSGFDDFFQAIMGQESGGNYSAVNKRTGALGAYQILPSNIAPWSRQYLGYSVTPSQFLNSPALQDKLARAVLQAQYSQYGAAGAASWWYSGSANNVNSTKSSHGEPSVSQYVQQVLGRMGQGVGVLTPPKVTDQTVKDSALGDLLKQDEVGPTMDALAGVDRGGLGLAALDEGQGLEAVDLGVGGKAPAVTSSAALETPNKLTVDEAAKVSMNAIASTGEPGSWVAPVAKFRPTSSYGMRNGKMHTGSDYGVPTGTALMAMSQGVVTFVGDRGGKGKTVVVRYRDGTESTYAHMDGFAVTVGQKVGAGSVIGVSGNTGNSTGPHLHLEIRNKDGNLVDPAGWLKSMGLI